MKCDIFASAATSEPFDFAGVSMGLLMDLSLLHQWNMFVVQFTSALPAEALVFDWGNVVTACNLALGWEFECLL